MVRLCHCYYQLPNGLRYGLELGSSECIHDFVCTCGTCGLTPASGSGADSIRCLMCHDGVTGNGVNHFSRVLRFSPTSVCMSMMQDATLRSCSPCVQGGKMEINLRSFLEEFTATALLSVAMLHTRRPSIHTVYILGLVPMQILQG